MGIDAISEAKKRAVREILAGYQEAFGHSWYVDHPGQEPTVDIEPVSEATLRDHYYKNGRHLAACPNGCTPARWRSFKAKMRNPEYFSINGVAEHETRMIVYKRRSAR